MLVRHHRLYDGSKPNIFEISDTAVQWTHTMRLHERYFMVQKVPSCNIKLEEMIFEFIEESDIVDMSYRAYRSGTLYLAFMKPSMNFPVFYEPKHNFFEFGIDEFINSNKVAYVTFDNAFSDGELHILR
jgi:hypothetical protein